MGSKIQSQSGGSTLGKCVEIRGGTEEGKRRPFLPPFRFKKYWKGFINRVISRARHFAEFEEDPVIRVVTLNHSLLSYKTLGRGKKESYPTKREKNRADTVRDKRPLPNSCNTRCIRTHYLKDFQKTTPEKRNKLYQPKADEIKNNGEHRRTRGLKH